MTAAQRKGQIRAALTALAGVLAAWGLNDGHAWMPVIAVALALYSLATGIRSHIRSGQAIAWSLIRKVINAGGAAAVTYGLTNPEQGDALEHLMAAFGPLSASLFSQIANDDDSPSSGGAVPVILLLCCAVMLLPSCGLRVTEDGCILGTYQRDGSTYYAGPCMGADTDGDGEADIDRYRVQWATDADRLRATYTVDGGRVLVEYQTAQGLWVGWSSKSGITLGQIPPPVEDAMRGDPQPIEQGGTYSFSGNLL